MKSNHLPTYLLHEMDVPTITTYYCTFPPPVHQFTSPTGHQVVMNKVL